MNDKRFVLFLGKGGVGKTVISASYALECAKKGKKTLLLNLHSSERVAKIFDKKIDDREITCLRNNLYATTVTPQRALEEYVLLKLKVRFIYRAVFENKLVSAFLSAIPGLNDLVMLGKAYWHVIEKENDVYVWDKIVVDAPATGHGIFFLQIPSVIAEILSSGNMYEEAIRMQRVLSDPETTELNLITLAEEMPVNESLMMLKTAKEKLRLPISHLIANGVIPPLFSGGVAKKVIHKSEVAFGLQASLTDRLFEAAKFRLQRQESQRDQLREFQRPIDVVVPHLFTKDLDLEMLEAIGERLAPLLAGMSGMAGRVNGDNGGEDR